MGGVRTARMTKPRLIVAAFFLAASLFIGVVVVAATGGLQLIPANEVVPGPGEIAVVDREAQPLPTVDPSASSYAVTSVGTDLATLREGLEFTVLLPQTLPEGAELVSVNKLVGYAPATGAGAELKYRVGDTGQLTITQTAPRPAASLSLDSRTVIREMDINGRRGFIYDPGGPDLLPVENRAILVWLDGTRMIEVRGRNLEYGVWLQLARSLE